MGGFGLGDVFGSPFGRAGGSTISNLVSIIISIAFSLAGIILLFYFVLGGIGIISGAGNNDPQQVAKGKQAITNALAGFMVVFLAYWIIRIIEIIVGRPFITLPGF